MPPTGAKGLNLAVSDVFSFHRALAADFDARDDRYLDSYSDMALRRVWGAVRLSGRLSPRSSCTSSRTKSSFEARVKLNELIIFEASPNARAALAEQYAGLPFEG